MVHEIMLGYKNEDDIEWMHIVCVSGKLTPQNYKLIFGFFEMHFIGHPADVNALCDMDNIFHVRWFNDS